MRSIDVHPLSGNHLKRRQAVRTPDASRNRQSPSGPGQGCRGAGAMKLGKFSLNQTCRGIVPWQARPAPCEAQSHTDHAKRSECGQLAAAFENTFTLPAEQKYHSPTIDDSCLTFRSFWLKQERWLAGWIMQAWRGALANGWSKMPGKLSNLIRFRQMLSGEHCVHRIFVFGDPRLRSYRTFVKRTCTV